MHLIHLSPAEADRATRAQRHLRAVVERDAADRQALRDRVRAVVAEDTRRRDALARFAAVRTLVQHHA